MCSHLLVYVKQTALWMLVSPQWLKNIHFAVAGQICVQRTPWPTTMTSRCTALRKPPPARPAPCCWGTSSCQTSAPVFLFFERAWNWISPSVASRGIFFQGYRCSRCKMAAHKECLGRVQGCGRNSGGYLRVCVLSTDVSELWPLTLLLSSFTDHSGTIKKVRLHWSLSAH